VILYGIDWQLVCMYNPSAELLWTAFEDIINSASEMMCRSVLTAVKKVSALNAETTHVIYA